MVIKSFNKKIIVDLLLLILILNTFVLALTTDTSQSSEGTISTTEDNDITIYENPTSATGIFEEGTQATQTEPATPSSYIPDTTSQYQINTIEQDTKIKAIDGDIFGFDMTNAIFSLGSLIQGSFISFSNNNDIYFRSLFDSSTFTATINKEGNVEVAQINGIGEMGKIVIEIKNGNLTQDDDLIFIPEGNDPTYIYYNTTEVEFKDGILQLQGESITNDRGSSRIEFDEKGFTKIQLQPDNEYNNFDYKIVNLEKTPIYICKNNPLCDINIEGSRFTINGKTNFSYKGNIIYSSYDENNMFIIDTIRGESSLSNSQPEKEIIANICTGSHYLEQTEMILYDTILEEKCPSLIFSYTYNNQAVNIQLDTLTTFKFEVYSNYNILLEKIKELYKLIWKKDNLLCL